MIWLVLRHRPFSGFRAGPNHIRAGCSNGGRYKTMEKCIACGKDAKITFRALEVQTLHVRDLDREKRVQALGDFHDFAVCRECAKTKLLRLSQGHTAGRLNDLLRDADADGRSLVRLAADGEKAAERCREAGIGIPAACYGVPDIFIQHGRHDLLLKDAGLTAGQIAGKVRTAVRRERKDV